MSPTVCRGSRDPNGSWKIIAMSRRIRRIAAGPMRSMSCPLNRTSPEVGSISRRIERPSVDFPHPDSPTRPRVSPCRIVRSTPSTARTWPTVRASTPERTGNQVVRRRTSTRGSAALQVKAESPLATASAGIDRTIERRSRLRHPAAGQMPAHVAELGFIVGASLDCEWTPGLELAAGRQPHHVRWRPLDNLQRLTIVGVEPRDGVQQRPRVGVLRMREDIFCPSLLDHSTGVHDDYSVADARDYTEIVGDQDGRHTRVAVQVAQEIEDLGLDGDVKGRGRFVGDEKAWAGGQPHRDHGPLAHAAGENVRILGYALFRFRDSYLLEHRDRRGERGSHIGAAVDLQRFSHLPARAVDGVEGGHRVLEDHRHLGAPDFFHLILGEPGQLAALEPDRSAVDPARAGQKPHDRERCHRLPGAGLSDDAERLARVDVERDSVDRPHDARFEGQVGVHVVELQQVEGHQERSLGSRASRSESPRRLKLKTVTEMAAPGKIASHGSFARKVAPVLIICPQSAVGTCAPSPRNDKVASARMAKPADKETWTMTGLSRFGIRWRTMMRIGVAPSERVAAMNSICLSWRTSARTRRA